MLRFTQSGSTVYPYTIDANSNRFISAAGPMAKTFTYDAAGNTLSNGVTHLTWNAANRLSQAVISSQTWHYQYNAIGERLSKSTTAAGHPQQLFIYNTAGQLVGKYTAHTDTPQTNDWTLKQETIWLGNMPVATLTQSASGTEIIVDNQDSAQTTQTGSWNTSSGANPYDNNSIYANANGESFQWNPDIGNSAEYTVSAWWTYWSNRDTSVTYRVHHVNGVSNVTVNQRDNTLDSQWNDLGTFTLDQSSYVEIIHDGGTSTTSSADAVRFTPSASTATVQVAYIHTDHLNTPRLIIDPASNTSIWRWENVQAFGSNFFNFSH